MKKSKSLRDSFHGQVRQKQSSPRVAVGGGSRPLSLSSRCVWGYIRLQTGLLFLCVCLSSSRPCGTWGICPGLPSQHWKRHTVKKEHGVLRESLHTHAYAHTHLHAHTNTQSNSVHFSYSTRFDAYSVNFTANSCFIYCLWFYFQALIYSHQSSFMFFT